MATVQYSAPPPYAPLAASPMPTRPSPDTIRTALPEKDESPEEACDLWWLPWNGLPTVLGLFRDLVLACALLALSRALAEVTVETLKRVSTVFSEDLANVNAYWIGSLSSYDPSTGALRLLSLTRAYLLAAPALLLLVCIYLVMLAVFAADMGVLVLAPVLCAGLLALYHLTFLLCTLEVVLSASPPPSLSRWARPSLLATPLVPLTLRVLLLTFVPVRLDGPSTIAVYATSTATYLVWWAGRQTSTAKSRTEGMADGGK